MHNIDIIGIENVQKYIKASKLSKFTISRANTNGSFLSVFECLNSNNNETAVNEFTKWAEIINNSMAYKIVLFDFAEITTDDFGNDKVKKAKGKNGKMESIFVINQSHSFVNNPQATKENNIGFDLQAMRNDIINEISKKQEENAILTEIRNLSTRLNNLESADDDDDDQEQKPNIGGIGMEQIGQIMGLLNMFKPTTTPPVINGTEIQSDEQKSIFKDNLNKAIKVLYKHNKQLDTDLLKLGDIAENKPDMFNMLISTLRNM
jgi:hypothetical protein